LFNKDQDEKYFSILNKHKQSEAELSVQGQAEMDAAVEKINQLTIDIKPSPKILNQNKILEKLVKQKEYYNINKVI
jgi:hypothetical protein